VSQAVVDRLTALHPAAILESGAHAGDHLLLVDKAHVLAVLGSCKSDPELAFEMLTDLTVVDYLGQTPRFEVVYHLYSLSKKHRIRIKCPLHDETEEHCWIDSATALWRAADWAEREAWDLYGVRFRGHPDLRRILMYDEFKGHPLRKDYPQNARQPLVRRPDAPPTDDLTTRLREHSHDRRV
jgi:NADH-quinone oxidoreductase subunit C